MKKKNILFLFPLLVVGLLLTSCKVDDNTDPTGGDSTNDVSDVYYNVIFDLNYQDAIGAPSAQSIKKGGLVTKPAIDPTRDGYDFTFWSKNMYGSSEWLFDVDVVNEDLTLYASWTPVAPVQKTYYVQIPTIWTSDGGVAGVYIWEDDEHRVADWPGLLINHVSDRLYSCEVPDEYSNFIFVRVNPNVSEWATAENKGYWGAQTIDLNKDEAGVHNLYTIDEDIKWTGDGDKCSGVWSTYNA